MMLLESIATVLLALMMLIPIVNIFVGVIVGAGLAGIFGGVAGLAIALLITIAEKWVCERQRWRSLVSETSEPTAPSPA